jgi:hypothetical protein
MTLDQVIQIDKTRSVETKMLSEFTFIVTVVIKEFMPLFRILLVLIGAKQIATWLAFFQYH